MRVPDRCVADLRDQGYLVFEGFLGADELAAAQEALWLHYPRPEEYFADPAAHAWLATDQWAGIVGGPWRSWSLNRLAFHPDLLDLAERFLGSADLRLYEAELWAKYAGAVDYDQRHHRDFVNHSLVVPKRSQPATQMLSWILLSDVGEEDGPTKVVPLVGRGERPVLARPWGSRHHELPLRGDVRGGGGLDDRSRRNPLHFSDRRTPPWVAHDRRTIKPLCAPRQLRRVGTALDRQSRLGRARDASRLVRDRRAGVSPGAVGVRLPRSGRPVLGRADVGRHPNALSPSRPDALPLRGATAACATPETIYRRGMRVHLDSGKCQGHNRCYALAPELFDVDDYGQAVLLVEDDVPEDLQTKARLAASNCPEYAITITE